MSKKLKRLEDLTREELIEELKIRDILIEVLLKANENIEKLLKIVGRDNESN